MKIISFEDIKNLNIDSCQCYKWVEEMIANKRNTVLPAKTHINLPGNIFCNVMPSILSLDGVKWGGLKVVTRYPERVPALDSKILLFNATTGINLALLDGNWITAMRTGAVAAHSVILFGKQNFNTIGMIGLGNTARAALLVLATMLSKRKLYVKLLSYKNQAELFAERFAGFRNLSFTFVDKIEKVIKGSDIIISCATYFENDICDDKFFDKGVLVVPVHTRGFTNCDLFFDKVFADDTGHVDHFKNFAKFKYYAEVNDVVNNKMKGRESTEERILTYNIGLSIHDINYAVRIYNLLKSKPELFKQLPEVDLCEPKTKFWV